MDSLLPRLVHLSEDEEILHSSTRKTKAFPLRILYTERFQSVDGNIWRKRDNKNTSFNKRHASVELLGAEEVLKFDVDGGLTNNSVLKAGCPIPKEIIAVVRPKLNSSGRRRQIDPKNIVSGDTEMSLEVMLLDFVPPEALVTKGEQDAKVVYSGKTTASTKGSVKGLYCFSTEGNQLQNLFTQMGTYMFHFSLLGSKYGDVPPAIVRINVAPTKIDQITSTGDQSQALTHRKPKKHKHRNYDSLIEDDSFYMDAPKKDITLIHVTTLDEVVSVNSFFAIAVFLGLAFSPPLPANQAATSLAPPRTECYVGVDIYRAVVLWEVVSFGCFLFSTLVAHGFKLFIVLENGRDKENTKSAEVNHKFLRFGILASGLGSILGAVFLIVSMIVLIQVRLGSLTCGNPWAVRTTVPFVALGVSGCAIFIVAVFYESFLE